MLKIFAVDLNQMSSLDEVWARRNWLRSTAFLAVYYVFFTVIHGLNSILPTANDPKNLFEIIFINITGFWVQKIHLLQFPEKESGSGVFYCAACVVLRR